MWPVGAAPVSLDAVASPVAACLLSIGMLFGGLNFAAGNPIVCLVASLFIATLLLLAPPPSTFWRATAPVSILAILAACWVVLPLILPSALPVVAPDLVGPNALGLAGLVAALYIGALLGFARIDLRRLMGWIVGSGCLVVLVGLLTRYDEGGLHFDGWSSGGGGRFQGTLGNPNVAGCYFGALAALSVALIAGAARQAGGLARADRRIRLRIGAASIALVLTAGACLLTGSRSAFAASLAAIVLLLLMERGSYWVKLTIAALLLLVILSTSEILFERLGALPGGDPGRILLWTHAWAIAAGVPLQGYGIGSFAIVHAHTLDAALAKQLWTINSAHNKPIQLVIEGGWPYFLLILAAAVPIAASIVFGLRRRRAGSSMAALAAAAAIVLACGMVDIALDVPALVAWMLFLAGAAWGRSLAPRRHAGKRPN